MRAHNTQTRNMSMSNPIRRLLFHLRKDISHYFRIIISCSIQSISPLLVSVLGPDHRDETELWPGEGVVEVVFQKVVLGKIGDVAGLDGGEEVDV